MSTVQVHLRMKKKTKPTTAQHAVPLEAPPSYDEALMLPDAAVAPPQPDQHATDEHTPDILERLPDKPSSAGREHLTMRALESELLRSDTLVVRRNNSIQDEAPAHEADDSGDEGNDDDEASYSSDDLAFEAYEDESDALVDPHQQQTLLREGAGDSDSTQLLSELDASPDASKSTVPTTTEASVARGHTKQQQASGSAPSDPLSPMATATRRRVKRTDPIVPTCVYDDSTYTIVTRLRAVNKRLAAELETQTRMVRALQDEKKQHLELIRTLRADLQAHRQTLKGVQGLGRRPHTSDDARASHHPQQRQHGTAGPILPQVPRTSPRSDCHPCAETPTLTAKAPASPRLPSHPNSPVATSPFKRSTVGWSRPRSPAVYASNNNSSSTSHHALQQVVERYAARLEKAEQDKRDTLTRHGHQLANYSHELSRLERQLDHAHKLAQEKETELRLQKTRLLYAHGASASSDTKQQHQQMRGLLADDFWRDLMPAPTHQSTSSHRPTTAMHTTHIGLAFEQLMSHPLVSLHDHALDASTREWLREVRVCGAQMLQLHRSFQSMSCTFQRLAESSHLYQLAETLARESRELLRAEQALVFVADTAEQEFWCRVPRAAGAKDMITVRSRIMPFATAGHTAAHAMHTGADALHPQLQHTGASVAVTPTHLSASGLPSGLASMVYHTKRPLLLDAGCVTKHPCFSTASDNTDRLIAHASASTLLLPVLHHGQAVAVVQLCGKTTVVEALGLSIALEKCEAFTAEDQALLVLLTHFASGLFPKVAYFTDVESNKVNEETLIQLAPEIFTCLRFEELGKIVIQNAKEILDADRCSLFVANNTDRTLHNWQSDISGGTVQVYDPSAGPGLSGSSSSSTSAGSSTATSGGMTIPFGHGIVGLVAETRQGINIPDAYEDPRFNSSWDKKTNYRTKSMLAVPILTNTTTRQPIRRASHVNGDRLRPTQSPATSSQAQAAAASDAELLGVVQVINKSGGAPFRAKDEFLLQTITKLIALAIENSQLFQKNQALCADVGALIARADLVDATIRLGAAAEAIIGVESAAVYVFDHAAQELVTFHRKRRHKVVVKEPMYRSALLGMAIASQDLVIVNDVNDAPCFNAYVDSIGGLAVRNVLFAPLVVADPDALSSGTGTSSRLVGLLHLVNTRGRKVRFERHDLFLSIVASLCCSVVASILAKQALLAQQEQTRRLLDTSMAFFKEMSPVGVINAVYNACTSLYSVEKAHLFLWEPDRRHMWTSKLAPHADAGASAGAGTSGSSASVLGSVPTGSSSGSSAMRGGTSDTGSPIPSLGAQLRRISVLTDQKLKVSTTEGLLEHVLVKGTLVLVKHWISENSAPSDAKRTGTRHESTTSASSCSSLSASASAMDSSQSSSQLPSKHALRATAVDDKAGFVKHAVVACPVWDTYGLEVVGVLVLLFPRGRAPPLSELANLPILCRQIAGALSVCSDLSAVTVRSRTLQSMLELSMKTPVRGVSLTLSARGQLVAFSQPLNVATLGFHAGALASSVHASAALNISVRMLPLADDGHRWAVQLSAATVHEMQSEHCVKWIGKNMVDAPARFDKLRTDLQSVFVRRESVRGVIERKADGDASASDHHEAPETTDATTDEALIAALPKHVVFQVRKLLWDFVDPTWCVDVRKACELFDSVDPSRERRISRKHLEHVLSSTGGRSLRLDPHDWDALHAVFADPATDLVPVERLFDVLAPRVRIVASVAYELVPVLDAVTQTVVSVHVLLTAL